MKLILIKWVDSVQPVPGWHFLDDAPENEITECQSVGWLVAENDVSVMIAQSLGDIGDDSRPQGSGFMRIPPKACIRERRELRRR